MKMFERRELAAMAWGYAVTVPLAIAAICLGSPPIIAAPLLLLGMLITLVKLNWS